jgi:hypothetical protein
MPTPYHPKIIVGGSLAALLYGYQKKIPVVWCQPKIPLFFETYNKWHSKEELWHQLAFQLSLSALAPMPSAGITSFRVEDGILKMFTDAPFFSTLKYDELMVFDDANLEGWDGELEYDRKYRVLDWINNRRSAPFSIAHRQTDDDFVREVYFYPSKRIHGNWSGKRDILAVSYLTKKQIENVEYCDTYVRFKVLHLMKEAGITGPKNGIDKKHPTQHKRLSIKLETAKREVERRVKEPYDEDELLQGFKLRNRHLSGKETY